MPLAHAIHGPRDGPVVVLLHGFPYDRRMWRLQVGPLAAAGYRVVVPDLPGFGSSDPVRAASVDVFADEVAALLRTLHVPRCVVVGFSMGGYVTLSLALRHKALVAGLALVDTRAEADSPEGRAKRDATLQQLREGSTRTLVAAMLPLQLTEATRSSRTILAQEVRDMMLQQPKASVAAAVAALRDRPDRTEDLASVDVPALVLVGEQDPVTPPSAARAMVERLPQAQLEVIPGAAHLSPMERPDVVNGALLHWLAKVAPAAA